MAERMQKAGFVHQLAVRMHTDDATTKAWVDATLETLYETLRLAKG